MAIELQSGKRASELPAIAGGVPVRPPDRAIVLGTPVIGEAEISSVTQCLRNRWIGAGAGVERFEREFARYKNAPYAAAVSSGTAAIHLALVALGIGPGDEVIAPTMTFCSTIHCIVHTGAVPVLADCDRETFNLDASHVQRLVTARTKAIIVVHMCGRCCEMNAILEIARRYHLKIIEDCAHAIESDYHGAPAGLMGDAGCFSFYATKNITSAEGGMLIARDRVLIERARLLSLHGMTADAWSRFSGRSCEYQVQEAGFKYNFTDLGAALALPQLLDIERRWLCRQEIWRNYMENFARLPVQLPAPPDPSSRHAYHLFTLLLKLEKIGVSRGQVAAALRAENIGTGVHYVPVHLQPYYAQRFGFRPADFPNAVFVGERTISLPISPEMSAQDASDVCRAVTRVLCYWAEQNSQPDKIRTAGLGPTAEN